MKDTIITGRIEFEEKGFKDFNRNFKATLTENAAFSYGNKTAVIIEWGEMDDGRKLETQYLDTRYDRTLKRDGSNFKEWLKTYFSDALRKHKLIID